MIIDIHCHATRPPRQVDAHHRALLDDPSAAAPTVSDDELRTSVAEHLRLMDARGIDLGFISPRAASMGHGDGDAAFSAAWTGFNNDLIARIADLYPDRFRPACQLPQSVDSTPANWIPELRARAEAGFVGVNVNPEIAAGRAPTPSLRDSWWDPLWETLTELDLPVMLHASASHDPAAHLHSTHYLGVDFRSVVELCRGDVLRRFPGLKVVIPHGGGATWFYRQRLRALATLERWPWFEETLRALYFDTAVYDQESLDLIVRRAGPERVMFSCEMLGTARALDPHTGTTFDDIVPQIAGSETLSERDRLLIFERNAVAVYGVGSGEGSTAVPAAGTA